MKAFLSTILFVAVVLPSVSVGALQQRQGLPTPPAGQTRPATPAPAAGRGAAPDPGLPADAVNVRLDFTITDTYPGTPAKKTVSMLVLSGSNASIRTSGNVPSPAGPFVGVHLNVDATVRAFPGGLIRANVRFDYAPPPNATTENAGRSAMPAGLSESMTIVLRDGKPLTVSQSADPATTRQVTVELTATIVK